MAIALTLHLLAAVVWVGGMFFAYLCLRPAAGGLNPPERLRLWSQALGRFFVWVGVAVVLLLVTGLWMVMRLGGMGAVNPYVHAMLGLGVLMMLLFLHVVAAPYRRLRRNVEAADFVTAGRALAQIRILVAVNLTLGVLVLIAAGLAQAPLG